MTKDNTLPALLQGVADEAARAERARVVAWLRDLVRGFEDTPSGMDLVDAATGIERGEHLK